MAYVLKVTASTRPGCGVRSIREPKKGPPTAAETVNVASTSAPKMIEWDTARLSSKRVWPPISSLSRASRAPTKYITIP